MLLRSPVWRCCGPSAVTCLAQRVRAGAGNGGAGGVEILGWREWRGGVAWGLWHRGGGRVIATNPTAHRGPKPQVNRVCHVLKRTSASALIPLPLPQL